MYSLCRAEVTRCKCLSNGPGLEINHDSSLHVKGLREGGGRANERVTERVEKKSFVNIAVLKEQFNIWGNTFIWFVDES